jgi:hypothetical protein
LKYIKHLFKNESLFLVRLLEAPAPLSCDEDVIGKNISWSIGDGVDSARAAYTGQRIHWIQQVFFHEVKLVYPSIEWDGKDDHVFFVGDTTARDIFEVIYDVYQQFLESSNKRLVFEGLKKIKENKYYLEVKLVEQELGLQTVL